MSDPQQPHLPPFVSHPGQQPPQPNYQAPAQPQAPQGYYSPPAQTGPGNTNTPGKIGLIIGLVSLGLGLLMNVIVQMLVRSVGYSMVSVVGGVGTFLVFAASAAALILGIIGLRKAGVPQAQAGIATGLGFAGVVGAIFNVLFSLTASLYY
ncbi:hypothetical protein DC31_07435 [Microbacterium sp. CH12i]|uniref:hypothetical protein n=1 Tax=Microbacterium sp. CH12i TaxID=1479651 RepID=UPI000460E8F1|nr:hypothetical protein [Microbacterium sp. CH12i]KDA06921.1 hypothetical protein DC31_07435 [Microbacterium sp. CH12i]